MDARSATTVEAYLATLPTERRAAIARVRDVVNANLSPGFEEGMQFGMISWYVPLKRYPDTYNGQPLALASLASQKSHMALYLLSVYSDRAHEKWLRGAFAAAGKRLDMGKSCVRFQSLDALPLDVIGESFSRVTLAGYLAQYEKTRPVKAKPAKKAKPAAAKPATARVRAAKR